MKLIQLLLPLYSNNQQSFPQSYYEEIKSECTQLFGGLTAYMRSPATGIWKGNPEDKPVYDDIVIYEIMTEQIDQQFGSYYKKQLQQRFQQDQIIIRVSDTLLL